MTNAGTGATTEDRLDSLMGGLITACNEWRGMDARIYATGLKPHIDQHSEDAHAALVNAALNARYATAHRIAAALIADHRTAALLPEVKRWKQC